MKKHLFLTLFASLLSFSYGQPRIEEVVFPTSAHLFGLYEIAFQLGDYSNPYDPNVIDVYAEFVAPDGKTFKTNGFYYEGYSFSKEGNTEKALANRDRGWRVRFTPDMAGTWSFTLYATDRNGHSALASTGDTRFGFQCMEVSTAQGFISKGNDRYLQRTVVEDGERKTRSFFPCGPNVAWYEYTGSTSAPNGIYDYERYIDALDGNANFMRIWLTRYQYLSLYGPEYTQRTNNKPKVYFDSTLNQKDAAELDFIVGYAAQHGISIMPCIFTYGDFLEDGTFKGDASCWQNNPFHTLLGLESPTDFFTDSEAIRLSKNLIRYIVARWGYATNIACWEFWNEVENIKSGKLGTDPFHRNIVRWHEEMADYIRSIDPFRHPITTSTVHFKENEYLYRHIFNNLDIVQWHTYGNIQKAKTKEQRSHQLFVKSLAVRKMYPDKLFFVGEFGFGQEKKDMKYQDKDPYGFDLHNCLWASLFSTSMGPASFWFWNYLEKNDLWKTFKPILTFSNHLPKLSESFSPRHTASIKGHSAVFPNGIQAYYMMNEAQDTLYGWCQDTAYSYQALRRLTDKVGKNLHFDNEGVFDPTGYVYTLNPAKKPKPSSGSNTVTLPISNQPIGTQYVVRWFDGETGLEITSESDTVAILKKGLFQPRTISFEFPSSVRDVKNGRINNTFGDAAFIIIRAQDDTKNGDTPQGNAANKTKKIRVKKAAGSQ